MTTINLKCVNCGAALSITPDIDRFACSYCGHELLVQRSGGIVALKDVSEAIKGVQIGTDKTAAELAMKRLEQEINAERQRLAIITATCHEKESTNKTFMIMGSIIVAAIVASITLVITGGLSKARYNTLAVIVFMAGFALSAATAITLLVVLSMRANKTMKEKIEKETQPTKERITALTAQWQKNRQIVDM